MSKVGDASGCERALLIVMIMFAVLAPIAAQQRDPLDMIQRQPLGPAALGKGATVLVLDQAEEPVVGAAVSVVSRAALFEAQARERIASLGAGRDFDLDEVMRRIAAANGRRYVTDQNGETRIPNAEAQLVVAVSGRRVGDRLIAAGETDVEIILEQREEAVVRVSDAAGDGIAGVPVTVAAWEHSLGTEHGRIFWTDEQGMAHIPRLDVFGAKWVHLGLLCVGPDAKFEAIDLARFASPEPIEVQAPEFGALKVICYDQNELVKAPRLSAAEIVIAHRASGHARSFRAAVIEPDGALFPCVALGESFRVRLTFADGSKREVEGDGPKRPRELTILTDTFDGSNTLTCDLVDASGAAFERAQITLVMRAGTDLESFERSTDEHGRLAFVIPPVFVDRDIELYLLQQRPARYGRLAACLGLQASHPARVRGALGRIQLLPEPILLSGTVVDATGAAVVGVPLRVSNAFRDPSELEWGEIGWSPADVDGTYEVDARTDAEGRFELRHVSRVPPSIEIDDPTWLLIDAPAVAVGDRDVRFTVARSGSIRGRLLDPPNPTTVLEIEVRASDGRVHVADLEPDGSFQAAGLMPGTCRVQIRGSDIAVDSVNVEAGAECADERLQALRWRDVLEVLEIEIEIEVAGGEPSPMLYVTTHESGATPRNNYHWLPSNEIASVLVPKDRAYQLTVGAPGHTTQFFDSPRGSLRVKLQPKRSVSVVLVGQLDLPPDLQMSVRFTLQQPPKGSEFTSNYFEPPATLAQGLAEAKVDGPGRYDLHLELTSEHANGWWLESEVNYPFEVLDFGGGAETPEYRIEVDDALRQKLAKAIDDIRSRKAR